MEKIRVLLVDHDEAARRRLRALLEGEPDIEICGACTEVAETARLLEEQPAHLVFLEVPEAGLNGADLPQPLGEGLPFMVFVTAHSQHALSAFEVNALDYLLKPFSDERFKVALKRARERIYAYRISTYSDRLLALQKDRADVRHHARSAMPHAGRLVLKTGSHLIFLDPEQVDWIEAEGVYVRVHAGEKSHLLRESLSNLERQLDARQFVRIHRSSIVNVGRIKEIAPHPNGGWIVLLQNGKRLRMSRSYRDRVSATLG